MTAPYELSKYLYKAITPFCTDPQFTVNLIPDTPDSEAADEKADPDADHSESKDTQSPPNQVIVTEQQDALEVSIKAIPLFGLLRMAQLYPPDIISIFAEAWTQIRVLRYPDNQCRFWHFLTQPGDGVLVGRSVELYRVHMWVFLPCHQSPLSRSRGFGSLVFEFHTQRAAACSRRKLALRFAIQTLSTQGRQIPFQCFVHFDQHFSHWRPRLAGAAQSSLCPGSLIIPLCMASHQGHSNTRFHGQQSSSTAG